MTDSLARRERADLCDLALVLGPDAPTLCDGWDATDLVTHLLVRERRPLAAAGIVLSPLAGLTQRSMDRMRRQDFGVLVERLRTPGLSPYAVPAIDKAANTLEYVVHHEDLRRGQPDWQPRDLAEADADEVWRMVRGGAFFLGRRLPAPVVLRRAGTDRTATLRKGEDPVTITGEPVELLLFLFGRRHTRDLAFDGPADRVAAVREADLGA